ncbi:MAG: glycosyl hydrolase family 18 protein [Chlamydiia bacterium]
MDINLFTNHSNHFSGNGPISYNEAWGKFNDAYVTQHDSAIMAQLIAARDKLDPKKTYSSDEMDAVIQKIISGGAPDVDPNQKEIQDTFSKAQNALAPYEHELDDLNQSIARLSQTLKDLRGKADQLPNGKVKQDAYDALTNAENQLSGLKKVKDVLTGDYNNIQAKVSDLTELCGKEHPTDGEVVNAHRDLDSLRRLINIKNSDALPIPSFSRNIGASIDVAQKIIGSGSGGVIPWQDAYKMVGDAMSTPGIDVATYLALQDYYIYIGAHQGETYTKEGVQGKIDQILKDHGVSPTDSIKKDLDQAKSLLDPSSFNNKIESLKGFIKSTRDSYNDLQKTIDGLPDGADKDKAKAALAEIQKLVDSLESTSVADLISKLAGLKDDPDLAELTRLAGLSNPTSDDRMKADALLQKIIGVNSKVSAELDAAFKNVEGMKKTINADLDLIRPTPPVTVTGQTAYIDWNIAQTSDWHAIFDKLKESGITNVIFSFCQVGDFSSNLPSKEAFDALHEAGMKASLAFGGQLGGWTGASKAQADALAEFAKNNGIDSIDMDYELDTSTPGVDDYFKELHSQLEGSRIPMTLTVMGSPSHSIDGAFKAPASEVFTKFDQYFDGLNLMLYDDNHQYLDQPTKDNTYLRQWLTELKNQNVPIDFKQIHIGFMDFPDPPPTYINAYPGSGTQGENAANTYIQVVQDLANNGFPELKTSSFGAPFWWPNLNNNQEQGKGYLGVIDTLAKQVDDFNKVMAEHEAP